MLKYILLASLAVLVSQSALPQKKDLEEKLIAQWPSLGRYEINDDGNLIYYFVTDGLDSRASKLHLYSVLKAYEYEIDSVKDVLFVNKGKNVLYRNFQDSVFFVDEVGMAGRFLCIAQEFVVTNNGRFLVSKSKQNERVWVILDLLTGHNKSYFNVSGRFKSRDDSGSPSILLLIEDATDPKRQQLVEPDPTVGKEIIVWKGENLSKVSFIKNARCFALRIGLITQDSSWSELWAYNRINKTSTLIIDDRSFMLRTLNGSLEDYLSFSRDGMKFIFSIKEKPVVGDVTPANLNLDIWSYSSKLLKSDEEKFVDRSYRTFYMLDLNTNKIHRVCDGNNRLFLEGGFNKRILIIEDASESWFRRKQSLGDVYLYSSSGDISKILDSNLDRYLIALLSPDERFVVWYNDLTNQWFSFDIDQKVCRQIAKSVSSSLIDEKAKSIGRLGVYGIGGWSTERKTLFVYDRFDIWEVSLDLTKPDINRTGGWGERNDVVLRIIDDGPSRDIGLARKVLINGFENHSKRGGYWQVDLSKTIRQLEKSHLKNFSVDARRPIGIYWQAFGKISAPANRRFYLVERENAKVSNNLYITEDLDHYREVSDIHPERNRKWLDARLLSYKLPSGELAQGILYLPEYIDTIGKKWPIIFNYYEKRSDEFNKFIIPEYSKHNINIPLFVAHGYLVFVPDIYSSPGKNGQGTVESVLSALYALKKLPYVDTAKMGLQGHSYGGWQTNYLIAHSKEFAAACEAAGTCNQISGYGQLSYQYGRDRQELYEIRTQGSPYGLNVTPWTNPAVYIDNSPIFRIGEIRTPLLMMHNKRDPAVPFEQAVEFFLGLRRAGRKAWLLQYNDYQHQLEGEAAKDFHMKMLEFFDHFLKGAAIPNWMI